MRDILTPCIKVCEFDWLTEMCTSCGRTAEEISDWLSYSDEQRQEIINNAKERLNGMGRSSSDHM